MYDLNQLDQARARFDAIDGTATRDPLAAFAKPNAATAAMDRLQVAFDARDWPGVRAACTADAWFEDRRRQALISGDIDFWLADMRGMPVLAPNVRFARSLIGTAGERLALERHLWSGGPPDGPIEIEGLFLTEVDETGRIARGVVFDLDDRRAAQREAWARWLAVDVVAAPSVALLSEMIDGFNDRDRARFRAVFADDLVVEDHRRTGMGRIEGADAYVDSVAVLWELAPASRADNGWFWLAYERHGAVTVGRRVGTLADGGAFESDYLVVFTVARGLVTRFEMFEIEALDAALARFAELRPDPLRIPPNAATRSRARWGEAFAARDWAAARALVSDGFTYEDRGKRALVRGDVETWIASQQFSASLPGFQVASELIGTVGDRIALEREVWSRGAGGRRVRDRTHPAHRGRRRRAAAGNDLVRPR